MFFTVIFLFDSSFCEKYLKIRYLRELLLFFVIYFSVGVLMSFLLKFSV